METLSDKAKWWDESTVTDVKEFIRELKDTFPIKFNCNILFNEVIDKLAGDKLI